MNAHRIETVAGNNQTVVLENLPFQEGEAIEVIVLQRKTESHSSQTLRGTVIKYDAPFESAALESKEENNRRLTTDN